MSDWHRPYVPYFQVVDKSRRRFGIVVYLRDGYGVPFSSSHRDFAHFFAGLAAERGATGTGIRRLLDDASKLYKDKAHHD